ncbi:MAG: hypothetical protein JJE09_06215 [Bacteroidia bacterium]|nr:hypothetical protein [Bacteroidia bacterium]
MKSGVLCFGFFACCFTSYSQQHTTIMPTPNGIESGKKPAIVINRSATDVLNEVDSLLTLQDSLYIFNLIDSILTAETDVKESSQMAVRLAYNSKSLQQEEQLVSINSVYPPAYPISTKQDCI